MRSFRPAHLVAPLALVVVVIAVLLIVRPGGGDDAATPAAGTSTTTARTATTRRTRRSAPRTYTVKANDTLSAIADETGVTLTRLQALNPDVDAGALRAGQRLKLTR